MKIQGNEVVYQRNGKSRSVYITYSQFAAQGKYIVRIRDKGEYATRYCYSTDSIIEAENYANKIFI